MAISVMEQRLQSALNVPHLTAMEQRLQSALNFPNAHNQSCSECDRPDNIPIWAAFLVCPVDQQLLGVVCCSKCSKLFKKVKDDDTNFTMKRLDKPQDWTEEYIEAFEMTGNKLVNACFEASVTNEKEGRDKRKYGYEAFFFEKYANLSFFDDVLYRKMIAQSTKELVERRFNKSLRGFNLKKEGSSRRILVMEDDSGDDNDDSLIGFQVEQETAARPHASAGDTSDKRMGMQKSKSARSVLNQPRILARKRHVGDDPETPLRRRLSSRNLMVAGKSSRNLLVAGNKSMPNLSDDMMTSEKNDNHNDNDSDGRRSSKISSGKMNDIRKEVLGGLGTKKIPSSVIVLSGDDDNDSSFSNLQRPKSKNSRDLSPNDSRSPRSNGMRRASSGRHLGKEDKKDSRGKSGSNGMSRSSSARNLGMHRASSGRNLGKEDSRGRGGTSSMRRASSVKDLSLDDSGGNSRKSGTSRSSSKKSLVQDDRRSGMKRESSSRSTLRSRDDRSSSGNLRRASSTRDVVKEDRSTLRSRDDRGSGGNLRRAFSIRDVVKEDRSTLRSRDDRGSSGNLRRASSTRDVVKEDSGRTSRSNRDDHDDNGTKHKTEDRSSRSRRLSKRSLITSS